jgi:hypothetical protein
MMQTPFPQTPWGEFWVAPVEDDMPVPSDVEFDIDTGRYRHIIDREGYQAKVQEWKQRELTGINKWLDVVYAGIIASE